MKQLVPVGMLALVVSGTTGTVRAQSGELALRGIAANLGFVYRELGPENAVSLNRPGVTILIRPGEETYEVNDRTETTQIAPRFDRTGLYVSSALAKRLGQIARQYPDAERVIVVVPQTHVPQAAITGSISFDVQRLPGREALVVSGQAPPLAPITLTITGTLSSDIPDVLLSRQFVAVASNGSFAAIVPIAPDYLRGSTVNVVATSVPGVRSARAQLDVDAPNKGVSVKAEQLPK